MAGFALEAVKHILAPCGWHMNTACVERINLALRQHVAAVGRRVSTLCKGEDGLRQQLAVLALVPFDVRPSRAILLDDTTV